MTDPVSSRPVETEPTASTRAASPSRSWTPAAALRELVENLGGLLSRGAIAGLVAGWAFILINMGWASSHGKPAVAPFLSISTIFYGTSVPLHTPTSVAVGVAMHLGLSLLFGMIFALAVPFLRRVWMLALGALVYGILLWVINFEIFGNTIFPWLNPRHTERMRERSFIVRLAVQAPPL